MSEELECELFDIFASGIFAFPVYEHNSARRIIRYLLMRGVPAEDVAAAIEDHAVDLRSWLERRPGHHMVGEWVMAWLNDSRDQYKADRRDRRLVCRLRRTIFASGNRHPSVSYQNGAPPSGDLEPFYGLPTRGRGNSDFDEVSSTTVSTTSSDSGTDDDDDGNESVSAVFRSRKASIPRRTFSERSSSQNTANTSNCTRRRVSLVQRNYSMQAVRQGTGSGERDDGVFRVSDRAVVDHGDYTVASVEARPGEQNFGSVSAARRATGSEGDLRRVDAIRGIVELCRGVANVRLSRSCSYLGRLIITTQTPCSTPEITKETATGNSYGYGGLFPVHNSSMSRYRAPPNSTDHDVDSIEYPIVEVDCRQRTTSTSTSLTAAAVSTERDSLPDPLDSGNVSDIHCNCSASVCCGGGVGYEHNCSSPVPDLDQLSLDVDARCLHVTTSLTSLPAFVVTEQQPVPIGTSDAWYGSCDRIICTLPQYVDQNGTGSWHRRQTMGYVSTSNLSTLSGYCRRMSAVDRPEIADGRWPPSPPPIHGIFPVS